MNFFSSKWLSRGHIPKVGTDKGAKCSIVSNVSSLPGGISEKTGERSSFPTAKDYLSEFLSSRLEIVPLGHCANAITYYASEDRMYSSFREWMRERGLTYPSREEFHEIMIKLFPEPHAKYHLGYSQWWGFRFNGYIETNG